MVNIKPVSDLRNNFTEIEKIVKSEELVHFTKNGYVTMVVFGLEQYAALTDEIVVKLDETDRAVQLDDTRYNEYEVSYILIAILNMITTQTKLSS